MLTEAADKLAMAWRSALGSFAILIAIVEVAPVVPPGFEHLKPDFQQMTWLMLGLHILANWVLLLSGIWLMFARCTKCISLLTIALLGFCIYLISVGFSASFLVLAGFGLLCAGLMYFMARTRFRLDMCSVA